MKIGKLPNDVLKKSIISNINIKNKEVLVGPNVGEDCSVIDFGDEVCVLTTDPITAAQTNIGTLGVHICCNDIASSGVRPLAIMVTLLAPPSSTLEDIKKIMAEINEACNNLSIDIAGGHTEITDAVNRIVVSITAIGKGSKGEYITTGGAKPGDDVIVTGYAGLEGTAILSKDYYEYLSKSIDAELIRRAQNMLTDISVVKAGLTASGLGVTAMHDATEGGILGAIWEVAEASNCGVYIDKELIPIKSETISICNALGIDPYRLISSGSMIITSTEGDRVCKGLRAAGIDSKIVGRMTENGMTLLEGGVERQILPPESDEIYNVKV